jgi:molybdopterin-guanine dinucleotide biosynthesis protein A
MYGLVLAGGKSVRMGQDKGLALWHGKPHRYYLAEMLNEYCQQVFISVRDEQATEIGAGYQVLTDAVAGMGPMGGLLSAFQKYPDRAWLVVACDLPLLDRETLQYLIDNRAPGSIATTFESPHDRLPEPLITIWEPASYSLLQQKANEGHRCPRRVLISNNITILQPPVPQALLNANTPGDAAIINEILNKPY